MTNLRNWLLFFHIVGATVWLGAWAAICVFAANLVRNPDPQAFRRFFAVMRRVGPALIGPATLFVLASGIALVARSERVTFGERWIVVGLALYVLATLVGIVYLRPSSQRVTRALDADDLPAAVGSARSWLRAAVVLTVLLLIATWDMVLRP